MDREKPARVEGGFRCPECGGPIGENTPLGMNLCEYCGMVINVYIPNEGRETRRVLNVEFEDRFETLRNYGAKFIDVAAESFVSECLGGGYEKGRGRPVLEAVMTAIRRIMEMAAELDLDAIEFEELFERLATVRIDESNREKIETFMVGYTEGLAMVAAIWLEAKNEYPGWRKRRLVDLRRILAGAAN